MFFPLYFSYFQFFYLLVFNWPVHTHFTSFPGICWHVNLINMLTYMRIYDICQIYVDILAQLTCWHADILKLACWMNQLLNCKLTFCPLNVNFPPFVSFAIKEIFNSQSNFRNCVLFHPEPTNFYIQWSVYKNISWKEHQLFV